MTEAPKIPPPDCPGAPLGQNGTPRSVSSYTTSNVTQLRAVFGDAMDSEMVRCPVEDFLDHYLPFRPSYDDISKCFDRLVQQGHLTSESAPEPHYRWADFSRPPAELSGGEIEIFKPLVEIAASMAATPGLDRTNPLYKHRQLPHRTTLSEIGGSTHQVDGFICPIHESFSSDRENVVATADLAAIFEFKRKNNEAHVHDNRLKMVSAANHCLNNDPTRTHTYGVTIENDLVRLWYFSRSHSVLSEPFSFMKNIKTFVCVMLSLLFAKPKEIGYDDKVKRDCKYDEKGKIRYIYQVNDRFFRTVSPIFEYRSPRITSRATRVWKVEEIREDGQLVNKQGEYQVLKDVWLDEGSRSEKAIQDAIFSALAKLSSDPTALSKRLGDSGAISQETVTRLEQCLADESYRNYFTTIAAHCTGITSKALSPKAEAEKGIFTAYVAPLRQPTMTGSNRSESPLGTFDENAEESDLESQSPDQLSDQSSYQSSGQSSSEPSPEQPLGQPTAQASNPTMARPRSYLPKVQHRIVFNEVCMALHHASTFNDAVATLKDAVFGLQLMFLAGWVHRDISSGNVLQYTQDGKIVGKLSDLEYAKEFDPSPNQAGHGDPKTGTAYFMAVEIHRAKLLYDFTEGAVVIHHYQHDIESCFWLLLWVVADRLEEGAQRARNNFVEEWFSNGAKPQETRVSASREPEELKRDLKAALNSATLSGFVKPIIGLWSKLVDANKARKGNIGDLSTYVPLYDILQSALTECLNSVKGKKPLKLRTNTKRKKLENDRILPGMKKRSAPISTAEAGHSRKTQRRR